MSDCVKRSALFGTHFLKTIPLTIDLDVFKPYDKTEACKILELSPAKRYILLRRMEEMLILIKVGLTLRKHCLY